MTKCSQHGTTRLGYAFPRLLISAQKKIENTSSNKEMLSTIEYSLWDFLKYYFYHKIDGDGYQWFLHQRRLVY